MRLASLLAPALALTLAQATAQTATNTLAAAATYPPPPLLQEAATPAWSFSAYAYTYLVPDSREYVQPTLTADHDWLHLEARYNYEGLKSGSLWVGYNFSVGEKLTFDFTPMLGAVLGNTAGVAPGYRFSLAWWRLELSSESEYLFNTRDHAQSFFYNWSELSLSPADWFRFGLALQRTRLYQSDREAQLGVLAGLAYKKVNFTTYLFNLDASSPTVVLALGLDF